MQKSVSYILRQIGKNKLFWNIGEVCAACGLKIGVDLALLNAIKRQSQMNGFNDDDEHYNISCLFFVFIAISSAS